MDGHSRGDLIASRYRLEGVLGSGGQGRVWASRDLLTGDAVALKLMRRDGRVEPSQVRREVAALRMLRVPGVVHLLDEGMDAGAPFVVLEKVEGEPFPGAVVPRTWEGIRGVTIALLDTLVRIHAAGVVHRDLKPGNVLVDASGRVTLLDFGFARSGPDFDSVVVPGAIVGTPKYLAPEQVTGDSVGPFSDLYSVGVMLYEALAGKLPHLGDTTLGMLFTRVLNPAARLHSIAPAVPEAVADLIDRMLDRDPARRPISAASVLRVLRGHASTGTDPAREFRWLGSDRAVTALVDAALKGQSASVVGPPGSGRSRCLREAARRLTHTGRHVAWLTPSGEPFGALTTLVGPLRLDSLRSLDDAVKAMVTRVREVLAGAVVLLADDLERLDPPSLAVLSRCAHDGPILSAELCEPSMDPTDPGDAEGDGSVVQIEALSPSELATLFDGPERVFHLQGDAARALYARSGGWPSAVFDEIDSWVRASLARWCDDRVRVDRDGLDRIVNGLTSTRRPASRMSVVPRQAMKPRVDELLRWAEIGWPHADLKTLAIARLEPLWKIEADVDEAVRCGAARHHPDGRVEPFAALPFDPRWTSGQQTVAQRAIAEALVPGAEGRLRLLVAGHDLEADGASAARRLAEETTALARSRAERGPMGPAVTALGEGLLAVRRCCPKRPELRSHAEDTVLGCWVEMAFSEGTPRALDRVLYEISRVLAPTPRLARMDLLARAALAARSDASRSLAMADEIQPFVEVGLELCRHGVRVQAARRASRGREEEVLCEVGQWAKDCGDPRAYASLAGWLGRLRYRQGRFDEAAEQHLAEMRSQTTAAGRLGALTGLAMALIDALKPVEGAAWAERLRDQAAECRHPYFELWGECLLRAAEYRMGESLEPDAELVELAARVGLADQEAFVSVIEGAVAWRAGRLDEAWSWAQRAERIWVKSGWHVGAALAGALADACSATGESSAGRVEWALRGETPRVALQVLALAAEAGVEVDASWREAAERFAAEVPTDRWSVRLEVMSVRESLDRLRAWVSP